MESVGGQAVVEGVMLRRKHFYSIAVRNPKGEIILKKIKIKDYRQGLLSIFKLPFFRGIYAMYEMMSIGVRSLIYSGNVAIDDNDEKLSGKELFWMIFFSMLMVIVFFIILPYILTILLGVKEQSKPILFNLVDALIKLTFFIGYVLLIGRMKDVKRIFQYHGAEHKVVHCYESGKKLSIENAKKFSFIHARCGSSFMMLTVFVSIILFTLLPIGFMLFYPNFFVMNVIFQKTIFIILRIIFIPIIIGVSYETIKLASKYPKNLFLRLITYPGHWLQNLTAAEPDKKQLEVAIASMNKLLS
jgi:uncharacterized protein YqhQ